MDAKITKSRLANFLAYDWLKILIAIGIAVAALCVFFTTLATRPRDDQVYELYAYNGLSGGQRSTVFGDEILSSGALSYDILSAAFESFDAFDTYGQAAYTARRAALQGKAIFVNGCEYTEGEGEEAETKSRLDDFIRESLSDLGEPSEYCNPYFDFPALLAECESYLRSVFGEDLSADPDEARVREIFLARNGGDKRFRTSAQKEKGVGLERERLIALREDYFAVREALDSGVFSVYEYVSPADKTYRVALSVGKLRRLTDLVYYTEEDESGKLVRKSDNIYFFIYNNGSRVSTDLKYESFSLLAWLLEEFNV